MTFEEMKYEIYTNGPMTVFAMASKDDCFSSSYKSGLMEEAAGNNYTTINHAMTIVGYGVEAGKNYLVIRNSWGTWWGEKGYAKLVFGKCASLSQSLGMLRPNF